MRWQNIRCYFNDDCRKQYIKSSDVFRHFVDGIIAVTAEVLILFKAKAWELHSNYCWLCAWDVISIKEQLKQTLQWVWHQTDSSVTNPKLVLIRSLCAKSSKGQELLMVRMMAEMMMKTTETVLPFSLLTLSYSLSLCSFCFSTSQNDQKAIKLQTRE